jgi:hypothetical protein
VLNSVSVPSARTSVADVNAQELDGAQNAQISSALTINREYLNLKWVHLHSLKDFFLLTTIFIQICNCSQFFFWGGGCNPAAIMNNPPLAAGFIPMFISIWSQGKKWVEPNLCSPMAWTGTVFKRVWKIAKICYLRRVCLSVCPTAWNNSAPTGRIFMKFYIWVFFPKICRENSRFIKIWQEQVALYLTNIHLFIISRSVLFRMRNYSDESCWENKNTHFTFNNFFLSKIVPFTR